MVETREDTAKRKKRPRERPLTAAKCAPSSPFSVYYISPSLPVPFGPRPVLHHCNTLLAVDALM